jgi:sortase A
VALWLERALLACGALLILTWLGAQLHRHALDGVGRAPFERAASESAPPAHPPPLPGRDPGSVDPGVDTSRWSASRLAAYLESLVGGGAEPLALLRIPSLALEVAVLEGTDAWSLNRAVGRIAGTAAPGAAGNLGIAGHRDGFFRALQDLSGGEAIELRLPDGRELHYTVSWIEVVRPEDVWVLEPTSESALTLVTCYPFYFLGSAPERYVVRAAAAPPSRDLQGNGDSFARR